MATTSQTNALPTLEEFLSDEHSLMLTPGLKEQMRESHELLERTASKGLPIYGVSRGFGPLAEFSADDDPTRHGLGLIAHLSVGQGPHLPRETTRLMMEMRLRGMTRGFSGIEPERWSVLARMLNAGFVPVVPSLGSVSASGDLIPLAHAASCLAGEGMAWSPDGGSEVTTAREALRALDLEPFVWHAREALAFVNGTSASLAATVLNHVRIRRQCWILATLTGVIVDVLRGNAEPYSEVVALARGNSAGHRLAASWVRAQITEPQDASSARKLQEQYSLRCVPQIVGSVLDFLDATDAVLSREVHGCSDNPVVSTDGIFHAGNFYAVTQGLASDQHVTLVHQVAYVAERQLALLVNPASNGNLPPLLASRPGANSGLAGVELAACAYLSEIRMLSTPATVTPVPANVDNQDVVPMALTSALRVARQLDLADLVLGSLGLAVAQILRLTGAQATSRDDWTATLLSLSAAFEDDRPLHGEVRTVADALHTFAGEHVR
ncbi:MULTISPECIES: aromatic amino acid ammonia-lyase [Micromonospora]|uniref:aromatic amino acid ammonia-lyase n=1 Tax=Micromonospora TaxID=1873 RepID=UPI00137916BF|nr:MULTISPECIES: aromatic amino acid ammonia-lyase [Micromonospora]MDG4750876.1 aromatic amino acid ammonia-lyase [Micromonospora sp. WMMD718]UFN96855.1 aromatic amino acid ammonia-lyase [Micromonospora aurantiaca]